MEATKRDTQEPVGALHKWSGQLQDILGLEATPGDEGMMAVEDAIAALIARAGTAGPPMPDKTPLELAHVVVKGGANCCSNCGWTLAVNRAGCYEPEPGSGLVSCWETRQAAISAAQVPALSQSTE